MMLVAQKMSQYTRRV